MLIELLQYVFCDVATVCSNVFYTALDDESHKGQMFRDYGQV